MWVTRDTQIALFKVNALPERRWSIQGEKVQLITEVELVNASLIFAIVYYLPLKLANKRFDEHTAPILHVYGKHIELGFPNHFNLLQHDYNLQHDNLHSNAATKTKIFVPLCGVAKGLQFCFTNITNKPSFNKQNKNEDFGIIEIYGYSLQEIPAPKSAIPMLNLSTFFQCRQQDFGDNIENDYKLLMTAAECDTMCGYVSIQARYFNQAKEFLNRAKHCWLKLYNAVSENEEKDERNSFLRQMRGKCHKFKQNALKLEVLIAFINNEHNDFEAQIKSILTIIKSETVNICDESLKNLLPLQIVSLHSESLIKTLLLTSKDKNEFVQLAAFKNICFIVEKLGCNVKTEIADILSEIFEFSKHSNGRKALHIQSITRQLIIIKHNICDSVLNLISDCNFEIVTRIFDEFIIKNLKEILKLEATKLAYCLRIFALCAERLHCLHGITAQILTAMLGLMWHSSKRVKTISLSIWKSFLFILPMQILQTNDNEQQVEIYEWLCHMIVNTELDRQIYFPQKQSEANTLLIRIPIMIINKMCQDNKNRLFIKPHINKLCLCLKNRILALLMNVSDIENYFEIFQQLLESLDFVSCSSLDYKIFDELILNVLNDVLAHLKTSSPSLIMLRVCIEFMEYTKDKFIEITVEILRAFHQWIPHSINDETFVFAKKLIDSNYKYLSHNDFCLIIESLLDKYTLRSTIYQELQHQILSKMYQRIHDNDGNDRNLFKLILKILIFEAAKFEDLDKMNRYFEFGDDLFQHERFQTIYIHDFNLIFLQIITISNKILLQCKNQQIVNILTDIVTSISLHFNTAIDEYANNANNVAKIVNIFKKITTFYINSLEINIANIQFHSVQNLTLFMHSIISIKATDEIYSNCILKIVEKLLQISLCSHFANMTHLCLWCVCNFYYEIARYKERGEEHENMIAINDTDLILKYGAKMMKNKDYKIRRWCGLLIFLRFSFFNNEDYNSSHESISILNALLIDCDESVREPLLALLEIEDSEHMIQYIESNNLLFRPNSLLTLHSENNNEVLIEGRSDNSDTASNTNKFNNKFAAETGLKIVDVDDVEYVDIISDEDDDKENINDDTDTDAEDADADVDDESVSSESEDDSLEVSWHSDVKNKFNIPLLPLHKMDNAQIQVIQKEELMDTNRNLMGDSAESDLTCTYIHSFLQELSIKNNTNDTSIDINGESKQNAANNSLHDEQLKTFKTKDLNDFLANSLRQTNQKNKLWMKYLNNTTNVNNSDES